MSSTTESRGTVLVVDDDPIALEAARDRLEALGYTVTTRDQSLGTSQWILENHPDVVLLDVMMPALSGGELARMLHERARDVAIILHSSKSQVELDHLAEETGALGALSKGLSDEAFRRQFERLLRLRRLRSAAN